MTKSCGNCAHANHEAHPVHGPLLTCTSRSSYFSGKAMPAWAVCRSWYLEDDEPSAGYFEQGDGCRTGASDQTDALQRLKGERTGRDVVNRVTVRIEQCHEAALERSAAQHVTETVREFPSPDFTLVDVLDVFEDALRGAGYHCPHDSLNVEADQ